MAGEHPKFGNAGGSPGYLDFGQVGGTRQAAGTALLTVHGVWGPAQVKEVRVALPEIDLGFVGILGSTGRVYVLEGIIRASTDAVMNAIEEEIEARRDGVTRARSNGARSFNADSMKPAALTTPRGAFVGLRVRLKAYEPQGMRSITSEWGALQKFRMVFEALD